MKVSKYIKRKQQTGSLTFAPLHQGVSPAIKVGKGESGKLCNVTRCQLPGAIFYNKSTQKYYCAKCALNINDYRGTQEDCRKLYGTVMLCEPDAAALEIARQLTPEMADMYDYQVSHMIEIGKLWNGV